MAFANDIILTYDDNQKIDDVMEFIIGLTPTETPLLAGLPKEPCKGVVHIWKEETLTTAQDNAVIEGAAFGTPQHDQPTSATNITQIFEKVYKVSSSDEWIRQYGFDSQFVKQEIDAMKKINTDIELGILRGSLNSGTGSAARRMGGLLNYISANKTSVVSGTKLTESFFGGMLQDIFDDGGNVDEVYTNSFLKRVISQFTAGNVKEIQADSKRVVNTMSVYDHDFGRAAIFVHRYMLSTSITNSGILMLNRMTNYIAVGEAVHPLSREEVAQTVHGKMGVIRGELTIAPKAQIHQGQAQGFWNAFN